MVEGYYEVCRDYVEKIFDYLMLNKTREEKRIVLNALRVCLSGQSVGPPIWDLVTIIWLRFGKQEISKRILQHYDDTIGRK